MSEVRPAETRRPRRPARRTSPLASLAVFGAAALGVIQFYDPPHRIIESHGEVAEFKGPLALASRNAFGRSGEVRVLLALPGDSVEYPVELRGDPTELAYTWVRFGDSTGAPDTASTEVHPLESTLMAPDEPGFYRLALIHGAERTLVDGPALSVMVPFSAKLGSTLNGYRIGTYVAERLGARAVRDDAPPGFVEVDEQMADLPLTKHLRLGDFLTHDGQDKWPRYAALDARLLDKIELVVAEIGRLSGKTDSAQLTLDVHSGFRTPIHNRRVTRAARDSRHQYGDAADIAIDGNGDGRLTFSDTRIVAKAVEAVEQAHPDLVGGMGLYNRGGDSYVHIDARGRRVRWRG